MTRSHRAAMALLALLTLVPATAGADGNLVIDLPGLPPPPPRPQPRRELPPTTPTPTVDATAARAIPSAPPVRRAPNRVGRLGVAITSSATITRLPQFYLRPVARVAAGTHMVIKEERQDWYGVLMIDGSIGWIPAMAVRPLDYDVLKPGGDTTPLPPSAEGLGGAVLQEAYRYLGVPYVWGGNGRRGVDCSGLVKNCFARCGVALPRRASEQALVGSPVPFSDGSALQAGDRLYFAVKGSRIDHTGIYIGDGYFIHASMSRGEVGVDRLSRPLFRRSLVAARRTIE